MPREPRQGVLQRSVVSRNAGGLSIIMKTWFVTGVLLMGLGFSAAALPPGRSIALSKIEAAWDAKRELHACTHLLDQPMRQCVARATALQTAVRDAPAVPEPANKREEARLERADDKYATATQRCSHIAAEQRPACVAAAKAAMVDAWKQNNRDSAAADAELTERPR